MIGHEEHDYGLLQAPARPSVAARVQQHAGKLAVFSLLLATGVLLGSRGLRMPMQSLAAAPKQWHGVSLGGWLVMEINPSKKTDDSPMDLRPQWMYDQLEANSELDFVSSLRREHGDAFAIATMRNHWEGYITDEMLDASQALGVDTFRIPVGYWIMDA